MDYAKDSVEISSFLKVAKKIYNIQMNLHAVMHLILSQGSAIGCPE